MQSFALCFAQQALLSSFELICWVDSTQMKAQYGNLNILNRLQAPFDVVDVKLTAKESLDFMRFWVALGYYPQFCSSPQIIPVFAGELMAAGSLETQLASLNVQSFVIVPQLS